MLSSSSSAAGGQGIHPQNTAPPDVSVNVVHYGQSPEALRKKKNKKGEQGPSLTTK